ncbi:MAG: DNA-protecting protein DprA, partial [Sphaerochaetaceae bacterium]|nr:DNA-protecting protein DprA [Sphaerochaetaceae bacterium]
LFSFPYKKSLFADCLSLEERKRFISEGVSESSVLEMCGNPQNVRKQADDVCARLSKDTEMKIMWYGDCGFPDFEGIERHLPYMLFYYGKKPESDRRYVSVVGTRRADYYGHQAAFRTGLEASANGISVVSGLAEGCDQAALMGALEGKTPCYAVLGCGLDVDYPSMSVPIKKRIIAEGGAVISRFAPGMPPLRQNFPNRNVIIAAMSEVTVVVQAPARSGALLTADFALQMNRDVAVVPEGLGTRWCREGTQMLYEEGAKNAVGIETLFYCKKPVRVMPSCESASSIRFGDGFYILKTH